MKLRRLVPALAVLAVAGQAAALDQVAPVTSLPTGDALLIPAFDYGSVPDADATYNADPAAAIDLGGLAGHCFAFSTPTGWRSFTAGILDTQHGVAGVPSIGVTTAGIAIVGTSQDAAVKGHWEYRNGSSVGWSTLDLSTVTENTDDPENPSSNAFLLPLETGGNPEQLRFVPDADSLDGYASLTFRIWDGSVSTTSTINSDPFAPQTFGGSPTAFSAETRTLKVHVQAVNDAPQPNGGAYPPQITAYISKTVGDLLATTNPFWDPDGGSGLGIAITEFDTVDAGWQYSLDDGGNWTQLRSMQPGIESDEAFVLAPDAQLRYVGGVGGSSGLLTVHAWDQTGGQASGSTITTDSSISGSSIGVDVLANAAPSIDSISGDAVTDDGEGGYILTAQRGQTTDFRIDFTDGDAGDVLAHAAASLNSSGGGTLSVVEEGSGWAVYRYTPGSVDPDDVEIEVRDLPGDAGESSNVTTRSFSVDLVNSLPDVSAPDGTTYTVRLGEPALTIDLSSSDVNGDSLLWAAAQTDSSVGSFALATGNTPAAAGNTLTYTPTAIGTDTITVTANDGDGDSTLTVTINVEPPNNAPTVALAGASTATVHVGDAIDLSVLLTSDDLDGDNLDWSLSSLTYGTAVLSYSTTGASAGNTAYYTPYSVGTDTLTITVEDPYGGTSSVAVTITVLPAINQPPTIASISRGDFAIVGQPFEAVVRADDPNADDLPLLSLAAVEYGGRPVSISRLGDRLWRVSWTPITEGSGQLNLTVTDPSDASGSDSFSLTYVAAPTPVSLAPGVPTSSAGSIVYGAIAPGYQGGFDLLGSFLNGQPRSVARAFWWSGTGYAELPGQAVSDPLRAGVFIASTVPANLTFAPPTQPAPFSITLRARQWTFFGIPPLMLNSGGGSETAHPWDDIRLQTIDGTVLNKWDALGPVGASTDADTQPWLRRTDLGAYVRTDTINSGTGYWLFNRGVVDYRLVRVAVPAAVPEAVRMAAPLAVRAAAAPAAAARPVSAADMPPEPPAGPSAAAAAADGGGGSCGAGGLAGLLIAGLALIGLRPRRRN